MSSSADKKEWFIYIGDHHEGPFSILELRGLKEQGQVSAESFVWKEGMPDWVALPTVPDLAPILNPTVISPPPPKMQPPPGPTHSPAADPIQAMMREPTQTGYTPPAVPVDSSFKGVQLEATGEIFKNTSKAGAKFDFIEEEQSHSKMTIIPNPVYQDSSIPVTPSNYSLPAEPKARNKKSSRAINVVLFLLILGGIGYWVKQNQKLDNWIEMLRPYAGSTLDKFFPPIPKINEISDADQQTLLNAAVLQPGTPGSVGLALSKEDLGSPRFYIAANLPDGASFDVELEGRTDTLLGHLSFSAKGRAVLMKRLGVTQKIMGSAAGNKLPQGDYDVFIYASDQQPPVVSQLLAPLSADAKGRRLVERRILFLGGARDENYVSRLNEFQQKIIKRMTDELLELGQLSAQMGQLLNMTATRFSQIRQLKAPALRKVQWMEFKKQWNPMVQQLEKSFAMRTPETLAKDFMYGSVYQLSGSVAEALNKVHQVQENFIQSLKPIASFEIEYRESLSQAEAQLNRFQIETNKVANSPKSPRGLPVLNGMETK